MDVDPHQVESALDEEWLFEVAEEMDTEDVDPGSSGRPLLLGPP
jgi:hypothetical protein